MEGIADGEKQRSRLGERGQLKEVRRLETIGAHGSIPGGIRWLKGDGLGEGGPMGNR